MEDIKYMVRVGCMTFNHAHYIEDAMNGFCMQETNFPFVCTIIDDCSTDGEQDVIKGYLEAHFDLEDSSVVRNEETDDYYLTFAQHKTNKNCYFAVLFLKYNHFSIKKPKMPYIEEWCDTKYVALCEGDDFWMRPYKLQKQIDFLENHSEYSLCFHNAVITYDDTPKAAETFNSIGEDREVSLEELIEGWINPTASIVYRSSVLPLFPIKEKFISGDWRLTLHCAVCGKVWAMKDVMSFYRLTYGTSSMTSSYSKKMNMMYLQKAYILESLNEFTQGKHEKKLSKYIRKNKKWGRFESLAKKRGRLIAALSMPFFTIVVCFKRLFVKKK